jgi:hypothetical protein
MPIEYKIDHGRRLVIAAGHGTFSDADVYSYQHDVWARPETNGYSELIDMSAVKHIALPSTMRMRQIATLAAQLDDPDARSRFAIIAPDDTTFGLGRMYATYRSLDGRSTKQVGVFRTAAEAIEFLGFKDDPPALVTPPESSPEPGK